MVVGVFWMVFGRHTPDLLRVLAMTALLVIFVLAVAFTPLSPVLGRVALWRISTGMSRLVRR